MTAPAATRRVTPTGVRVLPADADRDAWLDARRRGVGSSDVPAILGLTEAKNKTALHVWHDKRGELVDEDEEDGPMFWGRVLEEPVARDWARRNRSVVQKVGLVANESEPWQMATLDRRVVECPLNREVRTRCALEVKCRNAYTSSRWHAQLPDDVLAQTTWQIQVTGYDHIHVAVLIGGNDYRQTVVRRDEQVTGYVLDTVGRFYHDHMLTGVKPPADLSKAEALNELDAMLHPDRFGEVATDGVMEVIDYVRLAEAESAAKKEREAARAVLAQQANGAQYVMHEGRMLYQFTESTRSKPNLARLAERWPEAYADCVEEKTSWSIRIDPAFRASAKEGNGDGE